MTRNLETQSLDLMKTVCATIHHTGDACTGESMLGDAGSGFPLTAKLWTFHIFFKLIFILIQSKHNHVV